MKRLILDRKQKVSGFTLLEMVVVIAIIAILTTILIPTMRGYITKSHVNSANSEAKVLYNSIQTIMQEYEFRERNMSESCFYGNSKGGTIYMVGTNGRITHAHAISATADRQNAAIAYDSTDALGAAGAAAPPSTFGARLSRIYSDYDAVSWIAYIENYTVVGVLAAEDFNSKYVGAYPLRASGAVGDSGNPSTINKLSAMSQTDMINYCGAAWATS